MVSDHTIEACCRMQMRTTSNNVTPDTHLWPGGRTSTVASCPIQAQELFTTVSTSPPAAAEAVFNPSTGPPPGLSCRSLKRLKREAGAPPAPQPAAVSGRLPSCGGAVPAVLCGVCVFAQEKGERTRTPKQSKRSPRQRPFPSRRSRKEPKSRGSLRLRACMQNRSLGWMELAKAPMRHSVSADGRCLSVSLC